MTKIKNRLTPIIFLLLSAFFLRIILSPFGTLDQDLNTFVAWSDRLVEGGLKNFYTQWSDYLPGYLYILWFLAKVKAVLPIGTVVLYKLPAIIADVATGYLVYLILKKHFGKVKGYLFSAFYLFNPAVFANSANWGQVDSLTILLSLLSVYFLERRIILSAVLLALGTAIKPQAALTLFPIAFLMLRKRTNLKEFVRFSFIGLGVFAFLFLPFFESGNFFYFVFERVKTTLNQYPFLSVNAFNFWGLFGFWKKGKVLSQVAGPLAIVFSLFLVQKRLSKKGREYILLAVTLLAGFLFMTRFHERHLLPALAPILISASFYPLLWIAYIGLSFTHLLNLYYSHYWINNNFAEIFHPFLIGVFILINLTLFFFFLFVVVKGKKDSLRKFFKIKKAAAGKLRFKKARVGKKGSKKLLILILAFSLLTRLIGLGSPEREYFDEVYHAFTARRMLHGDPKAWEWWNEHPPGFAYEWTHPPLAKLGMVLGMKIFGEGAFGWRFPGALLGTLSIYLTFLIAKALFKDEFLAVLSAGALSLDGLFLVMGRIGMNDIYFVFFSLLTLYFFIKERNVLSAISLGLAFSSKWSALWLLPVLFAVFIALKKKVNPRILWFVVLPPLIYLIGYLPMFLTGHDLGTFVGVQKQMWWYHTRLNAEHAYTSPWWSWPLLSRPIYLYTSEVVSDSVSRIYAFGNPLFFWGGLISIFYTAYLAYVKKLKKLGLILFSYFVFFVSWAASPRIMFLYHYLPSLPFLAILIGFVLRKHQRLIFPFFIFLFFLFIYFYPHLAGLKVPTQLDSSYYWLPSWR